VIKIKNIKIKLLFLYSFIILLVLATLAISLVYVFGNDAYDSVEELEHILFIAIPIIVLLFILSAWFIINNIFKRVKQVIDEVKNIQIDELDKRIPTSENNDEINDLIITFNSMLSRLEDSTNKIKRFSKDVSHELKTPLTIIRGEIELGLRKTRSIEEYQEILKSSLKETTSLQDLINSLLFLSNTNQNNNEDLFEYIDLDEIILDCISFYKNILKEKNIEIKLDEFENITYFGHPLLMGILIKNIIQNAIKYSNNNSKIIISLNKKELIIKDYGIGIKQKDIKNIFNRFYRVEESRTTSGYGLGLSIVKNIANIHKIKIIVKSEYNISTEFKLNLI